MSEITRSTIASTRPVTALGRIRAAMVDYEIKRCVGATAVGEASFANTEITITFPATPGLVIPTIVKLENWGVVGASIQSGIVSSNGGHDLDSKTIEHNYTGDSAPVRSSGSIVTTVDLDGGNF